MKARRWRLADGQKKPPRNSRRLSRKLDTPLTHAQRPQSWLIDGGCNIKPVILLISRQGRAGKRAKDTVDLAGIITLLLKRGLHIPDDLVGRQIVVSVDRPIVRIDRKSTRPNSSHGYISYAVF